MQHRALAMNAALQGFVILMNSKAQGLPLKTSAKLAVLGPNINEFKWGLGNYHERKVI